MNGPVFVTFNGDASPRNVRAPLEFFRLGRHTDASGRALEFTSRDLDEIVASYDPSRRVAPIVIGHPSTDQPAYGWAEQLRRTGDTLSADVSLAPSFADVVREGYYRKVSASFWLATTPGNPTPGRVSLKHIGFLGAQAPAVKGLRPIELSEGRRESARLLTPTQLADAAERYVEAARVAGVVVTMRHAVRVVDGDAPTFVEEAFAEMAEAAPASFPGLPPVEVAVPELELERLLRKHPYPAPASAKNAGDWWAARHRIVVVNQERRDLAARVYAAASRLADKPPSPTEQRAAVSAALDGKTSEEELAVAAKAHQDAQARLGVSLTADAAVRAVLRAREPSSALYLDTIPTFGEGGPPSFAEGARGDDDVVRRADRIQATAAKRGVRMTDVEAVREAMRRGGR